MNTGKRYFAFTKDLFGAVLSCSGLFLCIEVFRWIDTASAHHYGAMTDLLVVVLVFPEITLVALVFISWTVIQLFRAFAHLTHGVEET